MLGSVNLVYINISIFAAFCSQNNELKYLHFRFAVTLCIYVFLHYLYLCKWKWSGIADLKSVGSTIYGRGKESSGWESWQYFSNVSPQLHQGNATVKLCSGRRSSNILLLLCPRRSHNYLKAINSSSEVKVRGHAKQKVDTKIDFFVFRTSLH